MPLTRITLCEGMSDAHLQQLSALYHQTLVEVFEVPPKDKFQILEILPASALIYDPHYQTGRRDQGFILFQILAGKVHGGNGQVGSRCQSRVTPVSRTSFIEMGKKAA